jgi:hypothetical protein
MSQDFVQLTSPPSVQFVEPGPNPSSQKALANRGHFRGWLVFALTVPAQAASDDGIVVDMRDLTNASALTGEGAQCVSAIGNDILSWDESVNPPVFACVDAIAIQWEAAAFKSELDRQTLEAGFRVVSEAGGLTQRTPLGFGALGAAPRILPGITGATAGTTMNGGAPLRRATLPRPVVVDYQGAQFTIQLPKDRSGSSVTGGKMVIALHGTWGTRGAGFGSNLNTECANANVGDEVSLTVQQITKILNAQ